MQFLSLAPFVPSGADFKAAQELFIELGFTRTWADPGYAGFENGTCRFILQNYNQPAFAENFMLSVGVASAEAFRAMVLEKQLPEKYGIRMGAVTKQPYGKEVNIIDKAGVCWHFVESQSRV